MPVYSRCRPRVARALEKICIDVHARNHKKENRKRFNPKLTGLQLAEPHLSRHVHFLLHRRYQQSLAPLPRTPTSSILYNRVVCACESWECRFPMGERVAEASVSTRVLGRQAARGLTLLTHLSSSVALCLW